MASLKGSLGVALAPLGPPWDHMRQDWTLVGLCKPWVWHAWGSPPAAKGRHREALAPLGRPWDHMEQD